MKQALLYLISGILLTFALPPFNIWLLLFAGFSLFYIQLTSSTTTKQAALRGWLFGFGYFTAGLWWIANALLVEGNEFRWVWPLAIAGLPAGLALFSMVAAMLAKRFGDLKTASGFLLFVACFALLEWLRGHIFTGFPWNLYGYGWSGFPSMLQTLSIGGPYFLTLLTVFWAALPAFFYLNKKRATPLLVLAIVTSLGCLTYGAMRLQTPVTDHDDLTIHLVQPNIAQEDKWNPEKAGDNLYKMVTLSENDRDVTAQTTLIIWPETALSDRVLDHPQARIALKTMMASYPHNVFLMTGMLQHEEHYYNSLATIDAQLNIVSSYHKSHLVPFGEYIPFQKYLPLTPFVAFEGFAAGDGPQTKTTKPIPPFSPLVCYEIIFPQKSIDKSRRPAWIINVTNDAWYGDSPGPRQHFAQARYRAIEQAIPVIRAANTGISGLIDPLGRVLYQAPLMTGTSQKLALPKPLNRTTLYSKFGDLFFWLSLLSIGVAIALLRRSK